MEAEIQRKATARCEKLTHLTINLVFNCPGTFMFSYPYSNISIWKAICWETGGGEPGHGQHVSITLIILNIIISIMNISISISTSIIIISIISIISISIMMVRLENDKAVEEALAAKGKQQEEIISKVNLQFFTFARCHMPDLNYFNFTNYFNSELCGHRKITQIENSIWENSAALAVPSSNLKCKIWQILVENVKNSKYKWE